LPGLRPRFMRLRGVGRANPLQPVAPSFFQSLSINDEPCASQEPGERSRSRGRGSTAQPPMNRCHNRVAGAFQEPYRPLKESPAEPHDQCSCDDGNKEARQHVGEVMSTDDDTADAAAQGAESESPGEAAIASESGAGDDS